MHDRVKAIQRGVDRLSEGYLEETRAEVEKGKFWGLAGGGGSGYVGNLFSYEA
jgi:hypothetical protein